eukprot:8067037-Ditylum_brightwellii.AAC.1
MRKEVVHSIEEHSIRTETSRSKKDTTFIDVPSESLADLSPQAAWKMIARLRKGEMFSGNDLKRVLCTATEVLKRDPTVIDLRKQTGLKTVTIVGDIHGDMNSLSDILSVSGVDMFNGSSKIPIKNENEGSPWNGTGAIIFNGDFVDRGENSVGVILILLLLKIVYPNNVYLTRGNHEDTLLSTVY